MLASATSRKAVLFLLLIVGCLLAITLYKIQNRTSLFSDQPEGKPLEILSGMWKSELPQGLSLQTSGSGAKPTTWNLLVPDSLIWTNKTRGPFWKVPLISTKDEQMAAGNTLHKMFTKDPLEYMCSDVKQIKNKRDGSWFFCNDKNFVVKPPCLVYSFGINYDFSFDDGMGNLGCDVHSFDPSMNTSTHRRNPHVMFYQIGLNGEDSDTYEPILDNYVKKKTHWKMRTLQTLIRELGHSDRIIDVLKIDVETSEWPATRSMLNTGVLQRQVKQFMVEWHVFAEYPDKETFLQLVEVLKDLANAGFKSYRRNPHTSWLKWDYFRLQADFGYINMNFTKFPSSGRIRTRQYEPHKKL